MSALMGPKLEYLHQYAVKNILNADGSGWGIEFENGAIVCNKDASIDVPPSELVGLALITTIFTATETTLRFGRVVNETRVDAEIMVTLNPQEYTIIDPRFEGQDEHYPQRAPEAEATLDTIRSEFDARAAEAPEPPAEDDESAEEGELPRIG